MLGRDRRGTPADWLVIGLGNPGDEYDGTRHNVGADTVDVLAARYSARLRVGKERARSTEVRIGGQLVAIAIPQTFMNLSGESARLLVARHGITDLARVIVAHDELDIPSAALKVKVGGGTAGHNGLKSLQSHLHGNGFVRIRIGIGRPPGRQDVADFVLRRPGTTERKELDVTLELAADAIESIITQGVDATMNRVNSTAQA
jgi:peptidyl-tRNA hydrolase, PTH1 family